MISSRQLLLFIAAVPAAIVVMFALVSASSAPGAPGDFLEYWSAFRLFRAGQNPYDTSLMLAFQRTVDPSMTAPTMMWNPPWVLLFFGPILSFDLITAFRLWAAFNMVLLAAASVISWEVIRGRREILAPVVFGFSFLFPIWNDLWFGQSSALLALASALLFRGLARKQDFLTGAALALFTIKPHVIYLVLVVVPWQVIRERRFRIIAGGAAAMTMLVVYSLALSHASVTEWIAAMSGQQAGAVKRVDWAVATLVGAFRHFYAVAFGVFPVVPMILIPGIAAIVVFARCIRLGAPPDWRVLYPPLVCWSLFTSAYGWVFDALILLPAHLAMLAATERAAEGSHGRWTVLLIPLTVWAVHGVSYASTFYTDLSQHTFFFIPLLTWLGLAMALRAARRSPENPPLDATPPFS